MTASFHAIGTTKNEADLPQILVNGVLIEKDRLAMELQYHPAASLEQAIEQAAQTLIIKELLLQEAAAKGLVSGLQDQDGEINEEDLLSRLIDSETRVPLTDEMSCRRYYEQNRKRFCTSALVEASHILIKANPQDIDDCIKARRRAEELLRTIQLHADQFAALAIQHSDCPSREVGGNLGQLSKGQTTPEFERQLFMLQPGLAQHPVESRYGFHVVRVDRKIEGEMLEFDQVKDKIAHYLFEQSSRRAVSQYLHGLVEKAVIEGIDVSKLGEPLVQ